MVVLAFLLISFSGFSQRWPFELWHDGKVILSNGDTLTGLVKYELQQEIVQFATSDKNALVYSARKVLFFEIFDNTIHQYRQFFALPYSASGSYEAPVFFELLSEGKLTLLTKEELQYRSVPIGYYGGSYTRQVLVNHFFLMNEKGKIEPFTGKKHDLLQLMGRSADAVDEFIRKNRLKMEEKMDFAQIIEFYNSLHKT
jgi:hypothetical protein